MAAGLGIVALGFGVLTSLTTDTPYVVVGAAFAVLGAGMGMTAAPATGEIMSSVPLSKAGVGSAVNDTTRELGGALGIALLGSVANSAYRSNVDFGGGRPPDRGGRGRGRVDRRRFGRRRQPAERRRSGGRSGLGVHRRLQPGEPRGRGDRRRRCGRRPRLDAPPRRPTPRPTSTCPSTTSSSSSRATVP